MLFHKFAKCTKKKQNLVKIFPTSQMSFQMSLMAFIELKLNVVKTCVIHYIGPRSTVSVCRLKRSHKSYFAQHRSTPLSSLAALIRSSVLSVFPSKIVAAKFYLRLSQVFSSIVRSTFIQSV